MINNIISEKTITNHKNIFESKGLKSLGKTETELITRVALVLAKAISCLTVVFAVPVFMLIDRHYKNVAKATILNDNIATIRMNFLPELTQKEVDFFQTQNLIPADTFLVNDTSTKKYYENAHQQFNIFNNDTIHSGSKKINKDSNLVQPKSIDLPSNAQVTFNKLETKKIFKIHKALPSSLPDKTDKAFGIDIFVKFQQSPIWKNFCFKRDLSPNPTSIHELGIMFCFYGQNNAGKWSMAHAENLIKRNRTITKKEVQNAAIEDIMKLTPLQRMAIVDLLSEGQIRQFFQSGSDAPWLHLLLKQEAGVNVQKAMYRESFSQDLPQELVDEANTIQTLLKEKYPLTDLNAAWKASMEKQAQLSNSCQSDPDKSVDWVKANEAAKELSLQDKAAKGEFTNCLSIINENLRPCSFNPYSAWSAGKNNHELRSGLQWVTIKSQVGQAFPAAPNIVADMVEETRQWLEKSLVLAKQGKLNSILVASELYFRLVSIHPMEDGNGRTSRVLMNKILYDAGLPVPVLKDSNAACVTARIEQSQSEFPGETKESVLKKILTAYKEQLAV